MEKLKSPLGIIGLICGLAVLTVGIVFFVINRDGSLDKALRENNIRAETGAYALGDNSLPEISEDDHIIGDLDSPVKIIIYSDFECPFCFDFNEGIKKVREEYKDKMVIAFRHKPLVFHPSAMPAALASECAAEQGKFWEMHDKLFEDAGENNLTAEEFKKDAGELGLKIDQFSQCFGTQKYYEKIDAMADRGSAAGADGTPTLFVNKEIYPGAYPFEDFTGSDGEQRKGMKSIIERHLGNE